MGTYKIIAFDMDGTLLTTKQNISPRVKQAIGDAADRGKHVVICTGRSLMELSDYEKDFERIRYYICENGTFTYDSQEKQVISVKHLEPEYVERILQAAEHRDAMLYLASGGQNIVSAADARRMEYFHAERYKDVELRTAVLAEDIIKMYRERPVPVEKMNVYSATEAIRDEIYREIRGLPVTIVRAEDTGLEITPLHTSKGVAFRELCGYLKIPEQDTVAVGDSDNDIEMLKFAGLAAAMGNARSYVKEICDITVSDNDNDGCAEVLERYMMDQ